jgi:hypothetical protein
MAGLVCEKAAKDVADSTPATSSVLNSFVIVISFAVELQAGIACKSGVSVCALCKRRVALREAQVKLVLTAHCSVSEADHFSVARRFV